MGLTNQETQLALAYKSLGNVGITVLSGENEQFSGCFDSLKAAGIPYVTIEGFDEHRDLWRLVDNFLAVTDAQSPDIVSVNTNWQLLIAGLARILSTSKYKIIYTVHGFRHNQPFKAIIARFMIGILLIVFADAINAPSGYVRKKFSFLRKRIKTVPLGEDDLFFNNREPPDFTKPMYFCFPGQFREGKNQNVLIEAFAEYAGKSNDSDTKLFLPGEGALLAAAKSLVSKLGMSGRIVFPGQLDRQGMVDIYRHCQVVIIPTNSETFGHCIAEPLVMKRIVLTRPVGIAPDFVRHYDNGFIFTNKSELVNLMLAIRLMDKFELVRIAQNAGNVGENFRWRNVAQQNVSVLMTPFLRGK